MEKETNGKVEWRHLLDLWGQIKAIAEILDFVAKKGKYPRANWKSLNPEQYEEALFRHFSSIKEGELKDKETGKSHWLHCAWNCMVLAWHEDNKNKKYLLPEYLKMPEFPSIRIDNV